MKYMKKPVTVDALHFTIDTTSEELSEFLGEKYYNFSTNSQKNTGSITILTLGCYMTTQLGYWIIKGSEGEFYPCEPSIFHATYSLV